MEFLHTLVHAARDPGQIIAWGGYPALGAIVFCETGALVFFLPGDSLLVIAGFYAAQGSLNLWALNALLIPLAILGDATSYHLGRRYGVRLFANPKARLLRPEHLVAAQGFYERHGGQAIVLARFVPIVRTFVPVVAGVSGMPYGRFALFNVAGGIGWVLGTTCTGYLLGSRFPALLDHIELVILAVVAASIVPGVIEWARSRRSPTATP